MYKYLAIVIGSDILNINYGADDDFTGVVTFRIRILLDDGDDNYTPGDLKSDSIQLSSNIAPFI